MLENSCAKAFRLLPDEVPDGEMAQCSHSECAGAGVCMRCKELVKQLDFYRQKQWMKRARGGVQKCILSERSAISVNTKASWPGAALFEAATAPAESASSVANGGMAGAPASAHVHGMPLGRAAQKVNQAPAPLSYSLQVPRKPAASSVMHQCVPTELALVLCKA